MLLRDRLLARLAEMGATPDYGRLAEEVLGIRHAPASIARRLVEQALVVEDRKEAWLRAGERICAEAPPTPGIYVLRDVEGRALYVGKANNVRRRLRTHFAARRWRHLPAAFARATSVEWIEVGSELEALLREADRIRALAPVSNVQVGAPSLETRALPERVVRDGLLVLPSVDAARAELIGVRVDGPVQVMRVRRDGVGLAARAASLWRFFRGEGDDEEAAERAFDGLAPLVFSWLAGRGAAATRLDPHDAPSARELQRRLKVVLADDRLFTERIVVIRSGVRSTPARP